MSSGLRKSTESGFIAPLLPTTIENNNMDTDSFDTPNSYPTPGQRQEDTATDYDSDLDLDLNETTIVSSVSKLEDYQKTADDAIKQVNTLMLERHRIATIMHSIDQVDVNGENLTLPPFLTFQLKFTAGCDKVRQAIFNDITKDLHQKGLQKLISTLKDTCEQIIREKMKALRKW